MTRVAVIADDYGLSPATSAAILALLTAARITGTSAMTIFPEWSQAGRALRDVPAPAVGLHLTLTDHAPLTAMPRTAPGGRLPSLGALWRAAWAGRIDAREVHQELTAQLDAFEDVVGHPPAHLDGHHHVQQLPIVRDVVTRLAQERLAAGGWVRTCLDDPRRILRRGEDVARALLFAAAGRPLARALAAADLRTNAGFTGVYGFSGRRPYGDRAQRFLADVVDGTVLVTHPGAVDAALTARDRLTAPREAEAAWWASDAWPALLEARGLHLAPP